MIGLTHNISVGERSIAGDKPRIGKSLSEVSRSPYSCGVRNKRGLAENRRVAGPVKRNEASDIAPARNCGSEFGEGAGPVQCPSGSRRAWRAAAPAARQRPAPPPRSSGPPGCPEAAPRTHPPAACAALLAVPRRRRCGRQAGISAGWARRAEGAGSAHVIGCNSRWIGCNSRCNIPWAWVVNMGLMQVGSTRPKPQSRVALHLNPEPSYVSPSSTSSSALRQKE